MRSRRSWRQQIKIHPVRTILIALLAIVIVLIILSILGYIFNWDWTGLNGYKTISTSTSSPPKITTTVTYQPGKSLWDWLQLLIIPAVLAVAGYVINLTISRGEQAATEQRAQSEREAAEKRAETEREIVQDNQREAALQGYINKMSELLLHEKLRESQSDKEEVRTIARVRTLTVLPRLDGERKRILLQFLHESRLIFFKEGKCIIDLHGADLSRAELSGVELWDASLVDANLREANLRRAFLKEANLIGADLIGADLSEAYLADAALLDVKLSGADLSGADLTGAEVTNEELDKAKSLKGATMPNGSIHP